MNYWLLLYDEKCSLCRKFIKFVNKFNNGEIKCTSLQYYLLKNNTFTEEELLKDIHLLGQNKEVLIGLAAINKIISFIPQIKKFDWLLNTKIMQQNKKIIYKTIKKYRDCIKCRKK